MNDEQQIRFALALDKDKPLADAVIDAYEESERILRNEREAHKEELKKLREENQNYRDAYHDQWYNQREIERCWSVLGGYNRKHLELHEAIREYIRNREWNYEENFHCQPDQSEQPSNNTREEYRDALAKELKIDVGLADRLVDMGVFSLNAMCGIEVSDLTDAGFSQLEAEFIMAAYLHAVDRLAPPKPPASR